MTKTEHLLSVLAEECVEVAHRVSKALRFGLYEVQPGQSRSNAERIAAEFQDVLAAIEMLEEEGVLERPSDTRAIDRKKAAVREHMLIGMANGALDHRTM